MRECREGLDFRITSGTEPTITVETVMQQGEKGRQILVWENYNRTIGEEKSSTNTAEKPAEISMSLTPDKVCSTSLN